MKARSAVRVLGAGVIACAALIGTAFAQSGVRDELRFIVQQLCLTHWRLARDPSPCMRLTVYGQGSDTRGFAVLADRKGGAHLLLIPLATISGVESGAVRAHGAFNFFAAAWQTRDALASTLGYTPPRATIGMAINPMHSRSQDQLHIHIACLSPPVYRALQASAANLKTGWSSIRIGTARYEGLRIAGNELGDHNPFELLATHLAAVDDATMGRYTILVAGMNFSDGPGFVMLAGTHVPPAERLLDGGCEILHQGRRAAGAVQR